MFSTRLVLAVFLGALSISTSSLVAGTPLYRRDDDGSKNPDVIKIRDGNVDWSTGALYFITNEPKGNKIIVGDISSDGKVAFSRAVKTRGLGAHGASTPTGPDALFSQGSIRASSAGNILATVNAGSSTVSVFSIDPKNPINIKQMGEPVWSSGEFPVSVAINKDGTTVCALNGGKMNGVGCYSVRKSKGLVPVPNTQRSLYLNQTTPPTGPAGTASQLMFSDDGGHLIASVKGTPTPAPGTPGYLAVWDVSSDGSLSQNFTTVAPPQGGMQLFSMSAIQGKNAVLVTDPAIGFEIMDLDGINGSGGNENGTLKVGTGKSAVVSIQGQKGTSWSSYSKKTNTFFLSDIGNSTITEVKVDDGLTGTIVKQYPQKAGSSTMDSEVATVEKKDFLYVLAPGTSTVEVLSLEKSGEAKNFGSFSFADAIKKAKKDITTTSNNVQGMATYMKPEST
ncbi:hypothetical protein ABKN59_002410 [Abortiporus biennis]